MKRFLVPALALPVLAAAPEPLFRLPSGLTVVLRSDPVCPLVRLTLRVDLPDDLAEADLHLLGSALARGGAGPFAAPALARQLEAEGHTWSFEIRGRSLVWSVLADSQDQEGAAEVLAHRVLRPDLVEGWQRLRGETAEPSGREAFRARWVRDPAHWTPPEGASPARLLAVARVVLRPERATLLLQGDVMPAQARQLALLQFGTWRPGPAEPLPEPAPRQPEARALVAPGPEGRVLRMALRPFPGEEGPLAAHEAVLAHRLGGLFFQKEGALLHQRTLTAGETHAQALGSVLADLDRRLAGSPDLSDLRALEAARASAALRQGLEPAGASSALPEILPLERLGPLLEAATVRKRLVVLLEGAGPEDQAALADLGLGPVQRFNR